MGLGFRVQVLGFRVWEKGTRRVLKRWFTYISQLPGQLDFSAKVVEAPSTRLVLWVVNLPKGPLLNLFARASRRQQLVSRVPCLQCKLLNSTTETCFVVVGTPHKFHIWGLS